MTEAIVYKTNMVLPIGEFTWVFLDNPRVNKQDPSKPPMYETTFLMKKDDKKVQEKLPEIKACIEAALSKKFGDKKPAKFFNPLRDGDVEVNAQTGEPTYPGYYYIVAKNKAKPGLVDADRNEIIETGAVWSGCKGRISVGFVGFDIASKKGVSCYWNNAQLTDNSAPKLSGKRSAEADFAEE